MKERLERNGNCKGPIRSVREALEIQLMQHGMNDNIKGINLIIPLLLVCSIKEPLERIDNAKDTIRSVKASSEYPIDAARSEQ
jgi:hypothetical protein